METPPPRHLYLNPRTEGDITSPGPRTWRVGSRRGSCSVEVGHCTSRAKGRQGKAGPEAGGAGDAVLLGVAPRSGRPCWEERIPEGGLAALGAQHSLD